MEIDVTKIPRPTDEELHLLSNMSACKDQYGWMTAPDVVRWLVHQIKLERSALRVACEEIRVRRGPSNAVAILYIHLDAVRATDAAIDLATGEPRT